MGMNSFQNAKDQITNNCNSFSLSIGFTAPSPAVKYIDSRNIWSIRSIAQKPLNKFKKINEKLVLQTKQDIYNGGRNLHININFFWKRADPITPCWST